VIRGYDEYAAGEAETIAGLETPDDHTLVVRLVEQTGDLLDRSPFRDFTDPAGRVRPGRSSHREGHDDDSVGSSSRPVLHDRGVARARPLGGTQASEPIAGYDRRPSTMPTTSRSRIAHARRNPSWDPATDDLRPAYPDRIEVQIGMADAPKDFDRQLEELAAQVDAGELDHVIDAPPPAEQLERYRADPELQRRLRVEALSQLCSSR